jgi:hypothetical protein
VAVSVAEPIVLRSAGEAVAAVEAALDYLTLADATD